MNSHYRTMTLARWDAVCALRGFGDPQTPEGNSPERLEEEFLYWLATRVREQGIGGTGAPPATVSFVATLADLYALSPAPALQLGVIGTGADRQVWMLAPDAPSDGANWVEFGSVKAFQGRSGDVAAQPGDYTAAQVTAAPAGGLAGTTVQDQLQELDGRTQAAATQAAQAEQDAQAALAASGNGVTGVFGRTGAVEAATGDYQALQIIRAPTTHLAATTVEGGLADLASRVDAAHSEAEDAHAAVTAAQALVTAAQDAAADALTAASSAQTTAANAGTASGNAATAASTADGKAVAAQNAAAAAQGTADAAKAKADTAVQSVNGKTGTAVTVGAADIAAAPTGAITGTTVQQQLAQLAAAEAVAGEDAVPSVFGRTGAIAAQAGDYDTAQIIRAATPDLAGTTAEAALADLAGRVDAASTAAATADGKAEAAQTAATTAQGAAGTAVQTVNGKAGPAVTVGAADIAAAPTGAITGATVQEQLAQLAAGGGAEAGAVGSVFGRTGEIAAVAGDYDTAKITRAATPDLAGTTAEAVLADLASRVDAAATAATTADGKAVAAQTAATTAQGTAGTAVQSVNGKSGAAVTVAAADIAATPTGAINGTTIQEQLAQLAAGGGAEAGAVGSVFGRTGEIAAVAGDYDTAKITRAATPDLAGTTAEAALADLASRVDAATTAAATADGKAVAAQTTATTAQGTAGTAVQSVNGKSGAAVTVAAADIAATPTGTINGATVQAQLAQLAAGAGGGEDAVPSVFGRTGAVVAVAGDYNTAKISRAATPNLAGTTAEAALTDLAGRIDAATTAAGAATAAQATADAAKAKADTAVQSVNGKSGTAVTVAAGDIAATPNGTITGATVQAQLAQLAAASGGGGGGDDIPQAAKYRASNEAGFEVDVTAVGEGVTCARAGSTYAFTVPAGVIVLSAVLKAPAAVAPTLTVTGLGDVLDSAAWRSDTGAKLSTSTPKMNGANNVQVTGLNTSAGVVNTVRLAA